jgi:DNA-binding protein H-NS
MEYSEAEKAKVRQHIANWKVVSEVLDKERTERLQVMSEEESAERFDGMDSDPSLIWTPEHRRTWSGLVEQQKYFAKGHEHASGLRRSA